MKLCDKSVWTGWPTAIQVSDSETGEKHEYIPRRTSKTLLPCPFCGGIAETNVYGATGAWEIVCSCGAEMNRLVYTEAEAIEAWNTRTERIALEQLCRDLYQSGAYCFSTTTDYARRAWLDDYEERMDALGLLEVDE